MTPIFRSGLACFALLASAQLVSAAPEKGFDPAAHAKGVRKQLTKFLKGRAPKKATRLEAGPGRGKRAKRLVLNTKRLRKHFWRYLPGFYREHLDKKTFLPLAEDSGPMVLVKPRITKVFVHRDCVSTIIKATPFKLSPQAWSKGMASKRFSLGKKEIERWDVWVRQGGKWGMARNRLLDQKEGQSPHMIKADRGAVSGEPLLRHPWFKDTVSINEMGTAFYVARAAARNKDPAKTEVQRQARKAESLKALKAILSSKEVCDVGWIESVKPGKGAQGGLEVTITASWFLVLLKIKAAEVKAQAPLYETLKKGEAVVFRLRYDPAQGIGLVPAPRRESTPSLARFLPK